MLQLGKRIYGASMFAKTLNLEIPSFFRDLAIVIFSSVLIGLLGQLAIPLPFSPVPIAMRNILVMFLAIVLGPRRAAAATFLFLLQGAAGILPFAAPLYGYLFGYFAAAFLTGYLFEKFQEKSVANTAFALAAGSVTIYILGAGYLSTILGVKQAFLVGVVPFLLGDALKIIATLKILKWMKRIQ